MKRGITWLASYPKSGNTWVRVFLTNYNRDADQPADINELDRAVIASARHLFDTLLGVEASDLTPREIQRARPAIYRSFLSQSEAPLFVKVHDAYSWIGPLEPLFPRDVTAATVYIVRNPLDVAVSFAHHNGTSADRAVCDLCSEDFGLADLPDRLHEQLYQQVGSWSSHVRSWLDESGLPVHVCRFEDLLEDPIAAFSGIVKAVGLEVDVDRIARAVAHSRFDRLQEQEREKGFSERSPQAGVFFREGRAGQWSSVLTPEQVAKVVGAHQSMMTRFGYLS